MNNKAPFKVILSFLVALTFSGCATRQPPPLASLKLEEHPLMGAPMLEPLSFQPSQESAQEVLGQHAVAREDGYQNNVVTVAGNPALTSLGDDGGLLAVLTTAEQGQPNQTITVFRGDELLLEIPAGLPSPALPLRGLWTYDGHWALEMLLADENAWAGQIWIDGQMVNSNRGYREAFGLQLLAGKEFYFFERDGQLGYSYDGQEFDLGYEDIPHYRCCSESALNPVQAKTMVAFFAVQGNSWYYVELGEFEE